MQDTRTIFHCDLDCFYASVHMAENPDLKGKTVAVCGDIEKRHGIILAKSYPAKDYGIKTGMAIWEAQSLCPDLILINADFELYKFYSKEVRKIYCRYTDMVEAFGLDENWLDITASYHLFEETPLALAQRIQFEVQNELGLSVSIGIGWNKILSKFGSDYQKPTGITYITEESIRNVFWPAPVEELLYVGRKTKIKLNNWGIYTIGDLAKDQNNLVARYGGKIGNMLIWWARGYDSTPVESIYSPGEPPKSVGNSITAPKDMLNLEDAKLVLYVLCESVATRLKEQNLKGRVISVNWRDIELNGFGKQRKISSYVDTSEEIWTIATDILKNAYDFSNPLRSIGVSVSDLSNKCVYIQKDLFQNDEKIQMNRKIDIAIDEIRNRFGHDKVMKASMLIDKELTEFNPLTHDIHPVGYLKK